MNTLIEKLTNNQQTVLDLLEVSKEPLKAYAILFDIQKKGIKSPLQVYRALDKLIEIGALEEAETIINQVSRIDSKLFERLSTISFLTGRIDTMCNQLSLFPWLNDDLTVKIICLSNLDDWNAAALILSSAVRIEWFTP